MKAARLKAFGVPAQVVECAEINALGEPAADELIVAVEAGPINPAELLLIEGRYASKPPLPAPLGIEGAGRVQAIGASITDLAVGDPVMLLPRTNWVEQVRVTREQVIPLPAGIDLQQASMLKVNPATALMMLENYVTLDPGDWVIQNAANSAVGCSLIALAKRMGVKTINVVRRAELVPELESRGADVVLVDGPDLAERARETIGSTGARVRLAIDAVAGEASLRLGQCLDDDGIVVNYGLLSGQPCRMGADQLVFRGLSLTGFWLAKILRDLSYEQTSALYSKLAAFIQEGVLAIDVDAIYGLTDVQSALAHATREGRAGKILIAPQR